MSQSVSKCKMAFATASGTATVVSSNIRTMSTDKNLFVRGMTIAFVAPTTLFFVSNSKYTTTVVVWFFLFFGLLEWSGVKRHIKVTLLLRGASDSSANYPTEYATPVPPPNFVIILKCLLSSLVAMAACAGSEAFLVFMVLYFLAWTLLTLSGKEGLETKAINAKKTIKAVILTNGETNTSTLSEEEVKKRETVKNFLCQELRMVAEKQPTELMLNFCLEYFGFVWITGVVYPLLVYDMKGVGLPFVLAALMGNFTVDIVALLVGRSLKGKSRPLCPSISPNKSLEGAIAGIVANSIVFAIILCCTCTGGEIIAKHWCTFPVFCLVGLLLGVMGVMGDLLQSLLKRTAKVKDSGVLMPGHGGVLDRIDGLLIVFPAMYCCVRILTLLP